MNWRENIWWEHSPSVEYKHPALPQHFFSSSETTLTSKISASLDWKYKLKLASQLLSPLRLTTLWQTGFWHKLDRQTHTRSREKQPLEINFYKYQWTTFTKSESNKSKLDSLTSEITLYKFSGGHHYIKWKQQIQTLTQIFNTKI